MKPVLDVKRYFNPNAVALVLDEPAAIDTFVFDEFFRDQADTWPFPTIGVRDLMEMAQAQPLTLDGTESVAIGRGRRGVDQVRPEPFAFNSMMTADQINDMRVLPFAETRQQVADSHIRNIRADLRVSINGLAAKAITTGVISWPIKVSAGGYDTFQIDFTEFGGEEYSILTVRPDVDLTALTGRKVQDWIDYVNKIESGFADRGLSSPDFYRLGRNAWNGLMAIASTTKQTDSIKAMYGVEKVPIATPEGRPQRNRNQSYIDVGGHRFVKYDQTYQDLEVTQAGLLVRVNRRVVADDNVHAVAAGVRMPFRYLSISDLDIDFAALPLALKTVTSHDPSGEKIIGQSRPIPIPIVKAIQYAPAKPV